MAEHSTTPIFYDPQQHRWRRFKRTSQALATLFSIIGAIFVASVLVNPVLPSLGVVPARGLPQAHHLAPPQPRQIPNHLERRFQRAKRRLAPYLATTRHTAVSKATAPTPHTSELLGFYVNWDDTSLTSLQHNLAHLDRLVPEWLHLARADGTVSIDNPAKQAQVLTYLRTHRPDLPITPLVHNFNAARMAWEDTKLAAMLTNAAARARAIQQLLQFVRDNRFAGINIDFENVPASAQAALKTFMHELYTQFHALGLEVSQSVPLDNPGFDYRGLAQWNDYLILMAYDEHWSSSKAGPIASQGWYTAALQRRFAALPPSKCVIALGNYGYDWQAQGHEATELSFQEALKTAQESEGSITFDPHTL